MTQERFSQIVDDPDLLRRITYEELKTLALAYPYAHNLRCLLAIKARQIDHPEAIRNLATAAAYSLDRTRLFLLAAPQFIVPQQILAPEEVLELKPIETIKRELEALAPVAREEKTAEMPQAESAQPPAPPIFVPEELAPPLPSEPEITAPVTIESVEEISTVSVPVQSFDTWISHFQPPVLEPRQPRPTTPPMIPTPAPPIPPAPKAPPVAPDSEEEDQTQAPSTGVAQQLAERSVAENKDVISETLAKLYAKQGYRDKSAQMYARLALLFPEKSAYFAAEIDKLKK